MAALLSNDILYTLFSWLEVVDPASARDIGWIRATHVCRSWREASLGFHALWARNVCTFPSQVGTMLGRAAGAPLHVRITQDYPNFPLGEILIGLVRSQPSRLGLLNCGHWVQPFIFHSALSGKMFVNLVELEITYTNDSPHVEVDPMHAPNLERATIHGRYAPIIAPRLRMLVLQHCDRSQRVVGLSSALDILESSPLLDKIHIFGIFNDLPDTSTRTVVISNASDVILIGTDQSFMQHIRILNNGRGQLIVLYPRGPLFSAPYAASSLARIIPECHELTFHQTRGSRDLILRHPTIHLRFRRELIFDDVSHAMEDALARYLPLEYVRKLQVIDYPADSLSATLVTALRNVGELSCLALYNRFLDSLPEGAFPAVQIVHQKSLSPAHAESEGWERLERFLAKRVVSGHPVPTLRLTGLSGYVSEVLLERLKTHISRLVDERME